MTRRDDVTDILHGVTVVDPYRWLEKSSPEFDTWLAAQDAHARRALRAIPGRDRWRDELRQASRANEQVDLIRIVGDRPRIFAMRRGAGDETARLVVRDGWDGADRVLVDPNRLGNDGVHVALDDAYPSPDGTLVAYVLAQAGSEQGTIEIVDVDSGRVLPDRIDRTQIPMVSWREDGRSFFHWRRRKPAPGDKPADWFRNSAAYLHVLGDDPDRARPVIAAGDKAVGVDPDDAPFVEVQPPNRWAIAAAVNVTEAIYFVARIDQVRPGATRWRLVATHSDGVEGMRVHGDRAYALISGGAPNYRIVSFDLAWETVTTGRDFLAESDLVLVTIEAARDALYVVALDRGIHRLFRVAWDTSEREEVPLPFAGSVARLRAESNRDGVVIGLEGWTRPRRWFEFDPAQGMRERAVALPAFTAESITSEEKTVVSRDGSEVPVSIVRRKDQPLDGSAPAILNGYGAYNTTSTPNFNPFTAVWAGHGGVYASCHVRGGGAKGKSWHLAGIKQNKENGVDDFIACAEYLIQQGYTGASRLTALGTSAGGVLVGGAITKRPDRFTASVLRVPVVNLIRSESSTTGPGNVPEFGSLAIEAEFRSMLASDPYHRVRDGVDYPAVLLTAGKHDPRVPAWQPAKFAARLQAMPNARPVLLRVEADAGHGIGSTQTQREEEFADIYAFALWRSGIDANRHTHGP